MLLLLLLFFFCCFCFCSFFFFLPDRLSLLPPPKLCHSSASADCLSSRSSSSSCNLNARPLPKAPSVHWPENMVSYRDPSPLPGTPPPPLPVKKHHRRHRQVMCVCACLCLSYPVFGAVWGFSKTKASFQQLFCLFLYEAATHNSLQNKVVFFLKSLIMCFFTMVVYCIILQKIPLLLLLCLFARYSETKLNLNCWLPIKCMHVCKNPSCFTWTYADV